MNNMGYSDSLRNDLKIISTRKGLKKNIEIWNNEEKENSINHYYSAIEEVMEFENKEHQDYNWKISTLSVFHMDGFPLYSRNFGSELTGFNSSLIFNFRKSLNVFANNSYNTEVVTFKIANEILFLFERGNFVFVVVLKVGEKVLVGFDTLLYKEIHKLVEVLAMILEMNLHNEITQLNSSVQATLTKRILDVNIENHISFQLRELKDFAIDLVIITEPSGIPLATRVYSESEQIDDPILTSMFLHSIQVFYETNFEDELRYIQFTDRVLYVKKYKGIFYGIVIYFNEKTPVAVNDPINIIGLKLPNLLIQTLEVMGDLDDLDEPTLNGIIDSFVFESTQDVAMEYTKRFRQYQRDELNSGLLSHG